MRLSVEPVPKTAWYTNVRSNVSRADWEKCKAYTRRKSGGVCEICGGVGSRYPTDAHEVWHYDDEQGIQTLVDLVALCPPCHSVKHLGRAFATGTAERAIAHLCRVNNWSPEHAEKYCMAVLEIWQLRSQIEWKLDINFLAHLGIDVQTG